MSEEDAVLLLKYISEALGSITHSAVPLLKMNPFACCDICKDNSRPPPVSDSKEGGDGSVVALENLLRRPGRMDSDSCCIGTCSDPDWNDIALEGTTKSWFGLCIWLLGGGIFVDPM
jgi:hypothetical protein